MELEVVGDCNLSNKQRTATTQQATMLEVCNTCNCCDARSQASNMHTVQRYYQRWTIAALVLGQTSGLVSCSGWLFLKSSAPQQPLLSSKQHACRSTQLHLTCSALRGLANTPFTCQSDDHSSIVAPQSGVTAPDGVMKLMRQFRPAIASVQVNGGGSVSAGSETGLRLR